MTAMRAHGEALSTDTLAVHAGRPRPEPGAPVNPDIRLSSTYHAGAPVGYSRESTVTWEALEDVVGALEHGTAVSFASGMAAANAVLDQVPLGASVVAASQLYGGVRTRIGALADAGRLRRHEVEAQDSAALADAVRTHRPFLVWVETPSNPTLDVCDLRAAAEVAHEAGALLVCDSTFATPLGQRALELGCDIVVHSATKYLSGHSDVLLGVAGARDGTVVEALRGTRHATGGVPGPVEAWLVLRGIRTLPLRWARAQASAAELARRLQDHPLVDHVSYPGLPGHPGHVRASEQMHGFGAIVSFEPTGDASTAQAVCEGTRLWVHATSLGGVESSLERRRRWAEESTAVPESLIRLSVGVEDVEDLWADLDAALRAAGQA